MKIEIATRLLPFSHLPGTRCVIPRSFFGVEVFPSLLRLFDMNRFKPHLIDEVAFDIKGPVKGFTVQQDLERGIVKVWGEALDGYFRYVLFYDNNENGIVLKVERSHEYFIRQQLQSIFKIKTVDDVVQFPTQDLNLERLSLGCHKAQKWCHIADREEMKEVLPYLYRFSQLTPDVGKLHSAGVAELLVECDRLIENQKIHQVIPAFHMFFKACYRNMFFPTFNDDFHQGFTFKSCELQQTHSPLMLLKHGGPIIRRMLIQQDGDCLIPLQLVPPEISCGRMTNIALNQTGVLDLEWRKRDVRRMVLRAANTKIIYLQLPKNLNRFRLKDRNHDKGKMVHFQEPIEIVSGREYYFDNFSG